jgi:hypothetical protein
LRAVDEGVEEAEVFGDGVGGAGVGWVFGPGEEVRGGGEVFCDGFFGQDVFSGCEGLFDVGWLGEDGEAVGGLGL